MKHDYLWYACLALPLVSVLVLFFVLLSQGCLRLTTTTCQLNAVFDGPFQK